SSGFPIYGAPDYRLLAKPLTPAQYAANLGAGSIPSSNRNDQVRAQLTQSSLFALPGGDAGLALVVEKGSESWTYQPDALLRSGQLMGSQFEPSGGGRDRYAAAGELNLPLFKMLTADLSGRYDTYVGGGARIGRPTYGVGLEFRPLQQL